MNKNIQLPRPSVVSSMLQMKNINPFAPLAPPATSSFTQPVVTKIDMCEIIYHQAVQASITAQNQEGAVGTYWLVLKAYSVNGQHFEQCTCIPFQCPSTVLFVDIYFFISSIPFKWDQRYYQSYFYYKHYRSKSVRQCWPPRLCVRQMYLALLTILLDTTTTVCICFQFIVCIFRYIIMEVSESTLCNSIKL